MAIAPISPLQSASRNLSALDSILARGGSSFDTAISNAVQIGRDLANKQSQQERNFQQEQRRGVNLAQRRAENMSRDLKDARNFDESQRKFDLDFGLRREEAADRAIHRDLNLDISRANLRERQEENLFRRDQRERTMADQQEEDLRDQEALQRNESFIESYESMENPSTADRIQAQVAYKQLGHLGKAARLGYVTRVEEAKNQAEKELAVKHQKAFKDWDTRFGGSHGTAKEMQRALSMTWEEFGPKADSPTLEDKTDKEKAAILKMSRDFYDAVHYLNGKAEDRAATGKDISGLSDLQKPVPEAGESPGFTPPAEGSAAESEGGEEFRVGGVPFSLAKTQNVSEGNAPRLGAEEVESLRQKGITRDSLVNVGNRQSRAEIVGGGVNPQVDAVIVEALRDLEKNDLSESLRDRTLAGGDILDHALEDYSQEELEEIYQNQAKRRRHSAAIDIVDAKAKEVLQALAESAGQPFNPKKLTKDQREALEPIKKKIKLAWRAEQVIRRNRKAKIDAGQSAMLKESRAAMARGLDKLKR